MFNPLSKIGKINDAQMQIGGIIFLVGMYVSRLPEKSDQHISNDMDFCCQFFFFLGIIAVLVAQFFYRWSVY